MLKWKHGCSLLQIAPKQVFRTLAVTSRRKCSGLVISLAEKVHGRPSDSTDPNFSRKRQISLTNQLVHTTLQNCPSDLVALSLFLWCAKQPNFFHNAVAFDFIVIVVSRLTKRFKTVMIILEQLEGVGHVTKAQTFLLLLRIFWRGKMYEFVFETFEQMGRHGFIPNTFALNIITDVLFKIGRADAALKVFKATTVPNFLTFNIFLCNLSKIKDSAGIRDAFRRMMRMGYYPNSGTFELILNCFCKMGRLEEAYQVLGIMTTLGLSMSVKIWTIIVDGFCRLHRFADASCLVKKMKKTGCSPNIVTYTTLLKGYMKAEQFNDAFDVLSIIESDGHSPDRVLYNVLIDSLAKIGRYNDAISLFLSWDKEKIFPDCYTLSSLLNTVCLSKRFFLLPELVDGFSLEVDLVACNLLLSYFGKAGFPSLALELYDEMLNRGLMPNKYSVLGLLNGLCESRRIDEAVHIYHGILLNYTGVDVHIHTVIIDGLIKAGKCHSAIRIFRKILLEENSLDVVSYSVAIRGLLRVGRATEARNLYTYMKEVGITPNGHICNLMLSSFCRERNLDTVKHMLEEMIDLRVELSSSNFSKICNALCKLYNSHLVICLLIEMRDLGLLPAKLACKTLPCKPYEYQYKSSNSCLENGPYYDTSGSEEYLDVAASLG